MAKELEESQDQVPFRAKAAMGPADTWALRAAGAQPRRAGK